MALRSRGKIKQLKVTIGSLDRAAQRLASAGKLQGAIRDQLGKLKPDTRDDIDKRCAELFASLRKNCPHLLPKDPIEAGGRGPQIDLDPKSATLLLISAARKISDGESVIIWEQAGSALEVVSAKIRLKTTDGRLIVTIPVRCDETGGVSITVPFAVGSKVRPSGMIATTTAKPIGPPEIIQIWGDALVAFAWAAIIEVSQALANQVGQDAERAGLIPLSLLASDNGLRVSTMARLPMDRRPG